MAIGAALTGLRNVGSRLFAKKASEESAKQIAKEGAKKGLASTLARDTAIGGGLSGAISAADGNDAGQVVNDIATGAGLSAGLGAGWRSGKNAFNAVSQSGFKEFGKNAVIPALKNVVKFAPKHPIAIGGALLAADAADSYFNDRPSAAKGLWDMAVGAYMPGDNSHAQFERGMESLKEKSNSLFGTNFATPLKDIEDSNKVFEARKKGLLDKDGNLPKNLQNRRVKAADIAKMKSRDAVGVQKQQQASQDYNAMPLPQINTLTPEQVAQVTNGSDEVGKWRPGGDGTGVIKRSDGTYAHVRPYSAEEQAARDRNYEDHISDQVNQYMLNALSMSQSPFVSPQRAAMYADEALGLRSVMNGLAARGAAGNAGARASSTSQNQWDTRLQESVKRTQEHAKLAAKDQDNKENALLEAALLTENLHDPEMFDEITPGDMKSLYKHEAGKRAAIDSNAAIKKQLGLKYGLQDLYMGNTPFENFANALYPFDVLYEPRPVINDGSLLGDTGVKTENLSPLARSYIQEQAIRNSPYLYEGLRQLNNKG